MAAVSLFPRDQFLGCQIFFLNLPISCHFYISVITNANDRIKAVEKILVVNNAVILSLCYAVE